MKEKLTNNLGLKLLSIVLAFLVWLVVVNISNPEIMGSKVVTVEVLGEENLTKSQLTYNIVEKNSVTVRYRVSTLDEYKIKSSDFKAYIDLNDLYKPTGAVSVKVEVVNNRELIKYAETKPEVLHIETENIQRKGFELNLHSSGELEEGYALGITTLNPQSVFVKGPESMVGQINSVGIEVNLEAANSDLSGTAEPKFYDANGNQLSLGEKVTVDSKEITYNVQILKAKNLTLDFEIEGIVAEGYRYTGLESDIQSVPVLGLKSVLASLNSITIPKSELNIDGATSDRIVKVDISQLMPPSTKLVGDKNMITITMKVEKLVNKTVSLALDTLELKGAVEDYKYQLVTNKTDVVIRGLSEDLDSLKPEELRAYLNVTDMEPGQHNGMIEFETEDGYQIISYSAFKLDVIDKKAEETTETKTETDTETDTESKTVETVKETE